MCRVSWKHEPLLKYIAVEGDLDAEAVQIYCDWLYTSTLVIPAAISRHSDAFNLAVLQCWAVADAMQDLTFKAEVVELYFCEARVQFGTSSVAWVFVQNKKNEEIMAFVRDVCLVYLKPGWFVDEAGKWPDEFVRELADEVLRRCAERRSLADVKRDWLIRTERPEAGNAEHDEEIEAADVETGNDEPMLIMELTRQPHAFLKRSSPKLRGEVVGTRFSNLDERPICLL